MATVKKPSKAKAAKSSTVRSYNDTTLLLVGAFVALCIVFAVLACML